MTTRDAMTRKHQGAKVIRARIDRLEQTLVLYQADMVGRFKDVTDKIRVLKDQVQRLEEAPRTP